MLLIKEAKDAVLYLVQDFWSNLQFIDSLMYRFIFINCMTTVRILRS